MLNAEALLREGAVALGLSLSDRQVQGLLDYLALIQKWNKVYNLTAVRDPQEMLTHHVLDSMAVLRPLQSQLSQMAAPRATSAAAAGRMLDVGSGAGLPGVVVAIAMPQVQVDCVDAVAKKAAFVQQAAAALQLNNLRALHARVEDLHDAYDVVSSRAFASLDDFTRWSAHVLAPGGVWMAMKGKRPGQELAALPQAVDVFHVEPVTVPGLGAERCIVWMRHGAVADPA